jgi:hypothetical protein
VALKTSEGLASLIAQFLKQEFTRTRSPCSPAWSRSRCSTAWRRLDHRRYSGGALLGCAGWCSRPTARSTPSLRAGLNRAYDAARNGLLERVHDRILDTLAAMPVVNDDARPCLRLSPLHESHVRPLFAHHRHRQLPAAEPPDNRASAASSPRTASKPSDQWIVERTGIRARHFAAPDVTPATSPSRPPQRCSMRQGRTPAIDLIIVATSTPDMVFPSAACIVQQKLGVHGCPAFDVQAVCSGFVYALTVADSMIHTGRHVASARDRGRSLFPHPRLQGPHHLRALRRRRRRRRARSERHARHPATELHADGRHVDILCVPGTVSGGKVLGDPLLKMDGQAVFKLAVGVLEDVARSVLAKADAPTPTSTG